jgi:hypothetical protein
MVPHAKSPGWKRLGLSADRISTVPKKTGKRDTADVEGWILGVV